MNIGGWSGIISLTRLQKGDIILKYIKKYWMLILSIVVIVFVPFILEWLLFVTPEVSKFSNETWFSFMGSYLGAVVTIAVFKFTIDKNDKEHKAEMKKQIYNEGIEHEIDSLNRIMNVLLLNNYDFMNLLDKGKFCSEYAHCNKDFWDIQGEIEKIKSVKYYEGCKRKLFIEKLQELEGMERLYLISTVVLGDYDNPETGYNNMLKNVRTLGNLSNNYREEIRKLFEQYSQEMREKKMF